MSHNFSTFAAQKQQTDETASPKTALFCGAAFADGCAITLFGVLALRFFHAVRRREKRPVRKVGVAPSRYVSHSLYDDQIRPCGRHQHHCRYGSDAGALQCVRLFVLVFVCRQLCHRLHHQLLPQPLVHLPLSWLHMEIHRALCHQHRRVLSHRL